MKDNRFQHYLVITDLLEAHVAALLEHERINMIRAWKVFAPTSTIVAHLQMGNRKFSA